MSNSFAIRIGWKSKKAVMITGFMKCVSFSEYAYMYVFVVLCLNDRENFIFKLKVFLIVVIIFICCSWFCV